MVLLRIDGLGDVLIEPQWLGLSRHTPHTLSQLDRLSRLNVSSAQVCQIGALPTADFVMVPIPSATTRDRADEGNEGDGHTDGNVCKDGDVADVGGHSGHAYYRHMLDKSRAMNLELDRRLNSATERTLGRMTPSPVQFGVGTSGEADPTAPPQTPEAAGTAGGASPGAGDAARPAVGGLGTAGSSVSVSVSVAPDAASMPVVRASQSPLALFGSEEAVARVVISSVLADFR